MGQDFTTMYIASLSWLQGHNPYITNMPVILSARLHVMQQGVVNSPLLLLLDAPLTQLAPKAAFLVYAGVQYLLITTGAFVLASTCVPRHRWLVTLAVLASPAAFLVAYYGQIGGFVFAFVALATWARREERWLVLGLCIAGAMIKPQLGLCAAMPLLWGAPRRAWVSALFSALTLLAIMDAILGGSGLAGYFDVLHRFDRSQFAQQDDDGLGISSLYRGWIASSLSGVLSQVTTAIILAAIGVMLAFFRTRPPAYAVTALTYLAVLALPYSHQYDAIVLAPSLLLLLCAGPRTGPARGLILASLAIAYITPLIALNAQPISFRLLPLGLIAGLTAIVVESNRRSPRGRQDISAPVPLPM